MVSPQRTVRKAALLVLLLSCSGWAEPAYLQASLRTWPPTVQVYEETVAPQPRYLGTSAHFRLTTSVSQVQLILRAHGYADKSIALAPGYFRSNARWPEHGLLTLRPVSLGAWLQCAAVPLALLSGLAVLASWRKRPAPRSAALFPSQLHSVGAYTLLEPIRANPARRVYRARHVETQEAAAVKLFRCGEDSGEIRRLLALSHPHIVRVLDYGEQGSMSYVALEWLPDGTLRDRLRQGPLSSGEARCVLSQLLEALTYMHRNRLVHADLKPENVLLGPAGVRLADLGHAVSVGALPRGLGTPGYLSPEQLLKQPLGSWTDQHALGLLTCELFTGRVPPDISQTLQWQHAPELPLELSAPLQSVLRRMLAPNPKQRFPSVREAGAALLAVLP